MVCVCVGSQTPPQPFVPAASPWLLAPSYPPWPISPPALPWSIIDHLSPRDSTPPATPHPSGSVRLLPPSSPPWTLFVILLLGVHPLLEPSPILSSCHPLSLSHIHSFVLLSPPPSIPLFLWRKVVPSGRGATCQTQGLLVGMLPCVFDTLLRMYYY